MVTGIYLINSLSGNPGHLSLREFGTDMTYLLLRFSEFRAALLCMTTG